MGTITTSKSILPESVSRTGVLFALLGGIGLFLPAVQFKANRIVLGDAMRFGEALPFVLGYGLSLILALILVAALLQKISLSLRLALGLSGLVIVILCLGLTASNLMQSASRMARVSPAVGFWLLVGAFSLMSADALTRLALSLRVRCIILLGCIAAVAACLGSGLLNHTSVMVEYSARSELFVRSFWQHITLAFGSLGMALLVGLPVGVLAFQTPSIRSAILGGLNILQTIPSLALFGIMIPLFSWVASNIPGAAQLGVAGIGIFPALIALFCYSLLPIVSNTLVGLKSVDHHVRDAAFGLGLTKRQVLFQVQIPLALPVVLAAVRIVLVQNIGLAVIAGLIGGGGFGSFVFQGLNQTALDLILLGALPTIFLALIAGIGLDFLIEGLASSHHKNRNMS